MPKELKKDRKNVYRREETSRVRQERIITGYVKHRHREIYDKACAFYQHLDKTYPTKKDLRRTNEYLWLCDGTEKVMRKYYPRNVEKKNGKKENEMVLNIPLLSNDELPAFQHHTVLESSMQQEPVVVEIIEPTGNDESSGQEEILAESVAESVGETTEPSVNDESSSQDETTAVNVAETTEPSDLLPLSEETMEQIISDLQQDPDISNFFDEFDYEFDDCPLW